MAHEVNCPQCGTRLSIEDDLIGSKVQCPSCHHVLRVRSAKDGPPAASGELAPDDGRPAEPAAEGRPVETAEPEPPASTPVLRPSAPGPAEPPRTRVVPEPPRHKGFGKANGTNVNMPLTGIGAVGVTVFLFLALYLPLRSTSFGASITKGLGPYVFIVLLTAWSVFILIGKWRKLRGQKACVDSHDLAGALPTEITRENVEDVRDRVRGLHRREPHSFFYNRVLRALEHFRSRASVQEMAGVLESQAAIDAAAVDSSYSLLKAFIWAIPILGFIGTVLGIGQAVHGFSGSINAAQDLEVIKTSLGAVTTGLAVAFQTTLVALVMSVFLMLPAHAIQKAEEDVLNRIDEYCNDDLLRRVVERGRRPGTTPEAVRQAVDEAFSHQKAMWQTHLKEAGTAVTAEVASGWREIHEQLQGGFRDQMAAIQGALDAMVEERRSFVDQVKAVESSQVRQLSEVVSQMGQTAREIEERIAERQKGQVEAYEAVNATVTEQFRGVAGQIGEALGPHLAALGQMRTSAEESARALAQHMEQARAVHSEGMTAAAGAFNHAVREALEQLSASQEEPLRRLAEIATAVAEKAQMSHQEVAAAGEAMNAAQQQLAQIPAALEQSTRQHIEQLSAAAGQIVSSLGPNIERALQTERQSAATTAAEHLAEVSRVGRELVASLTASQAKLDEHITRFIQVVEGQQHLSGIEQALSGNLELLGRSEAFHHTLAGVNENLVRLRAVLDSVAKQAGIIWPKPPRKPGPFRRTLRRLTGGDHSG